MPSTANGGPVRTKCHRTSYVGTVLLDWGPLQPLWPLLPARAHSATDPLRRTL